MTWTRSTGIFRTKALKPARATCKATRGVNAMSSSLETFEHKYGTSQQRLNELLHWAEDPNIRGTMPTQMVEELSTALEELHVAAEIMHEQAEQLGEAHNVIEAERCYFQELFDLAPDGYVVTDQDCIIRRAN